MSTRDTTTSRRVADAQECLTTLKLEGSDTNGGEVNLPGRYPAPILAQPVPLIRPSSQRSDAPQTPHTAHATIGRLSIYTGTGGPIGPRPGYIFPSLLRLVPPVSTWVVWSGEDAQRALNTDYRPRIKVYIG
eukprot:6175680-Pyramimonas_sp.AAC.1